MKKKTKNIAKTALLKQSDDASRTQTVRNLRYLGRQLCDQAFSTGATALMVTIGWEIYHAEKQGLLKPIINIGKVAGNSDILSTMEKRYAGWRRRTDLLRADPHFEERRQKEREGRVEKSFEKCWEKLRARGVKYDVDGLLSLKKIDVMNRVLKNPELEFLHEADNAAQALAVIVCRELACRYNEQLPAEVTSSYVHFPDLSGSVGSSAYHQMGRICDFLATQIVRGLPSTSEGFITLTDAEVLTGIDKGQLSKLCDAGTIEGNNEVGPARRLLLQSLVEYVKKKEEAAVRAKHRLAPTGSATIVEKPLSPKNARKVTVMWNR